jgi:hypothetical protein
MLLNRVGMPEAAERNVNINVTLTAAQKVAEIRCLAEKLGLDAKVLLGSVSATEFEDLGISNG